MSSTWKQSDKADTRYSMVGTSYMSLLLQNKKSNAHYKNVNMYCQYGERNVWVNS